MNRKVLLALVAGSAISTAANAVTAEQMQSVDILRQYCQACHAVGDKRFIVDDDNEIVWEFIQTQKAPQSKILWRDAIMKVLNWPSDAAPPFNIPMETNRDWMPKGGKRLQFSAGTIEGQTVRSFILDHL